MTRLRRAAAIAWVTALAALAAAVWPGVPGARLSLLGASGNDVSLGAWATAILALALAVALSLWPLWRPSRLLRCAGFCAGMGVALALYVSVGVAAALLALAVAAHRAGRAGEPVPPRLELERSPTPDPPSPDLRQLSCARGSAAVLVWIGALMFLLAVTWSRWNSAPLPFAGLRQLMDPEIGWPMVAVTGALAAALSAGALWNPQRLAVCSGLCMAAFLVAAFAASPAAAGIFASAAATLRRTGPVTLAAGTPSGG